MSTAKQIFSRGWLGNSASVFTQGYHPRSVAVADGLLCAVWAVYVPGATVAVFAPSATMSLSIPAAAITVEVC